MLRNSLIARCPAAALVVDAVTPPKRGVPLCAHRRRAYCVDCSGSQTCAHGKVRAQCRECEGAAFCEHDKRRSRCTVCGGSAICPHGREISWCADCGIVSRTNPALLAVPRPAKSVLPICLHKRRTESCVECSGCVHGKLAQNCNVCDGRYLCVHGRRRYDCVVCSGARICRHKRRVTTCVVCGGGELCVHGQRRFGCRRCAILRKRGALCPHGLVHRHYCHQCGGTQICPHGRRKDACDSCGADYCSHGNLRVLCKRHRKTSFVHALPRFVRPGALRRSTNENATARRLRRRSIRDP